MREDGFLKSSDVAWVMASNFVALIAAVITGIALPRFTGYETYAGYREYTLFIAFSGILHIGFVQGIQLKYGELDFNALPAGRFRLYFRFLAVMELLFTAVLILICIPACSGRITPLFFVIVNAFIENLRCYLAAITVFTGRFRLDSVLQIIYRMALIIGFSLMIIRNSVGWLEFLLFITLMNILVLTAYIVFNSAIVFGSAEKMNIAKADIIEIIRRGCPVLFGEQLSLFIFGADSIFARAFFDSKQFSQYSFAVYIVVTAFTVINAANAVIFPYLKRQEEKDMEMRYLSLKRISLIMSAIMSAFFMLCPVAIRIFMPGYMESISFLGILWVTLFFRTLQGLACANTMKALDMEKEYFRCNLSACILAVLSDTAAYLIWKDLKPIAVASVLVYAFWYFRCDMMIKKRLR